MSDKYLVKVVECSRILTHKGWVLTCHYSKSVGESKSTRQIILKLEDVVETIKSMPLYESEAVLDEIGHCALPDPFDLILPEDGFTLEYFIMYYKGGGKRPWDLHVYYKNYETSDMLPLNFDKDSNTFEILNQLKYKENEECLIPKST